MGGDVTPEELVRLRGELNQRIVRFRADGTSCIGACTPDVRSEVGAAIRSFERTLYRASGYFHLYGDIEYRYPEIAAYDAGLWRMIRDGSDRYARAANRRVQDAAFSEGRARPWTGVAGDHYAAHLPDQEAAARAMYNFADKCMGMLNGSKQWFQGVLNSLRSLGAGIISAESGVVGSMTTLAVPIRRVDGLGFALGVQAWLHGTLPLFDGYLNMVDRFEYDLRQAMDDVEYLINTPDNAFPGGKWPDPTARRPTTPGVTERPTFPYVYADEHSVDISTVAVEDTLGAR